MTGQRGSRLSLLLALMAATACAGVAAVAPRNAAGTPDGSAATVWDGVYAERQAARGEAEYATACSSCHSDDLRGNSNAPGLIGVGFLFLWGDRSLHDLFTAIQTSMPTNAPNSLPAQSYLDILAYVMKSNDFPAGENELGSDPAVLERIMITAKPGR